MKRNGQNKEQITCTRKTKSCGIWETQKIKGKPQAFDAAACAAAFFVV